jgi:serine/threonine-protein kinase HipA
LVQSTHFDTNLAMAFGDVFTLDEVTPFALADFAGRCGINRTLLRREAQRLASVAVNAADELAGSADYRDDERAFVAQVTAFIGRQAGRLASLAREAATIPTGFL